MARSLNKVELIGNLTRDPELRYTPAGAAVCTFGLATNRQWTTDAGEKKEDAEFHRIVAWNKLAELCAQLLAKGRKVYVEGRLQTRRWTAQDGSEKITTEIVINDMIILDSRSAISHSEDEFDIPVGPSEEVSLGEEGVVVVGSSQVPAVKPATSGKGKKAESKKAKSESEDSTDAPDDDIPF